MIHVASLSRWLAPRPGTNCAKSPTASAKPKLVVSEQPGLWLMHRGVLGLECSQRSLPKSEPPNRRPSVSRLFDSGSCCGNVSARLELKLDCPYAVGLTGTAARTRCSSKPSAEDGSKTTCRLNQLDTCLISSGLSVIGFDQGSSTQSRPRLFGRKRSISAECNTCRRGGRALQTCRRDRLRNTVMYRWRYVRMIQGGMPDRCSRAPVTPKNTETKGSQSNARRPEFANFAHGIPP